MLAALTKYKWLMPAAAIILLLLLGFGLYYWGKRSGSGNVTIDESQISEADKAQANEIVQRIHNDLESGWLFGYNIWGNLGRDADAYWALAAFSDTLFGYAYNKYKQQFGSSLVADIRNESSLPSDTYKKVILDKAEKLNLQ